MEPSKVTPVGTPVQDFKADLYVKWATGAAYCVSSTVMQKIRDILRYKQPLPFVVTWDLCLMEEEPSELW